jgi:hypothetical protein
MRGDSAETSYMRMAVGQALRTEKEERIYGKTIHNRICRSAKKKLAKTLSSLGLAFVRYSTEH